MKNIASNPSLIKIEAKYTTAVGHLSAELARHLQDGRLAASEVEAILYKVGTIIAENSGCLAGKEHKLVGAVVSGLIEKAVSENGLNLRGESLSTTIQGVLKVVAAHGKLLQVDDDPLEILVKRVQSVFDAIIDTAKEQLGQSLNQQALPAVIIQLFGRWANDEVFTLDITDAHFKAMFKQATAEAMAIAS